MKYTFLLLTLLAFLVLLAFVLYQNREKIYFSFESRSNTTSDIIDFYEAKKLIEDCQVKKVFQTQDKRIGLKLTDGFYRSTFEGQIDEVLDLAQKASQRCGFGINVVIE